MNNVTTIIPIFEPKGHLLKTVSSLHKCETDIVLIEDGPQRIPAIPKTRLIRTPQRRGPAAAINTALKEVSTEFVTFVDQDDLVDAQGFSDRIQYLNDNPNVQAVMGNIKSVVDDSGNHLPELTKKFDQKNRALPKMIDLNYFMEGGWIPLAPLALTLFRSSATHTVGLLDESYKTAHDVEYLFRFLKSHPVRRIDSHVLSYRVHGENASVSFSDPSFLVPKPRQRAERWLIQQSYGVACG